MDAGGNNEGFLPFLVDFDSVLYNHAPIIFNFYQKVKPIISVDFILKNWDTYPSKLMNNLPTLYKRDAKGNTMQWTIFIDNAGYFVKEGLVGGKITETSLYTCEPKNTGKKNATTGQQQAEKEALSVWDKKQRRGYTQIKEEIDNVTFLKPMKGDKWVDRQDEVVMPVIVQDKLNGIRCQNNKERAYSTGGETFHTIPHIRLALKPVFDKYPGAFLDGEGYNPSLENNLNRLISLVSVVIKPKDLTPELLVESERIVQFWVFDGYGFGGITPELPYRKRHAALISLIDEFKLDKYIKVLPYWEANNISEILAALAKTKRNKKEGLMIRWGACPFVHKRNKYLLKLKNFESEEFIIVDVQEGNGDWKGCAKRIILQLPKPATTGETTFASNIDGDRAWLRDLYLNKEKVIGLPATCEFQCWSEYQIPQIPWVRNLRTYE